MNDIKIMVKGWVKVLPFYLFTLLPLLASCSERDDTPEEFPDWKNQNEQFFEQAYLSNEYDFKLLKYSLVGESSSNHTDYILVKVIEEGKGETTPYLNDSVSIHYVGWLIPSTTYKDGFQFDKSYLEPFDWDTAVPSSHLVNGTVSGFATALSHMHRGDHWLVIIPYQLGYGTSDHDNVPAYSTLMFEVRLEDFWTKKKGDRY